MKAAAEISMGTEVTFYFCGNDLSFDYKIKKCSAKKKIVRLVLCLIAILNYLIYIVSFGYETSNLLTIK